MTCKDCISYKVCKQFNIHIPENFVGIEKHCEGFKNKSDFVEVVRCKDCIHAIELDKHCEINRSAYKHCVLLRGEEENNVWHKYKKYYKDYSIVELDGFCSYGEKSVNYGSSKTERK